MSNKVSTAEQIEFTQIFARLAKDFKMTKAGLARSLHIQRSYVSMILNAQRSPQIRLLEAFRALEVRLRSGGDQGGVGQDEELIGVMVLLRKLKKSDPATFLAVKRVVEGLEVNKTHS